MSSSVPSHRPPARVVVVGAGIVGLSCAWSLQDYGIEVCVVDRGHPGAGASWQNAGYVSPAMCVPLPEPSILRYGATAVLRPGSPVNVLWQRDARLALFLAGLARHCTTSAWRRGLSAYRPLNDRVLESYARQRAGGVDAEVTTADVLCCVEHAHESAGLLHEMEEVLASGQRARVDVLAGDEARELEPHLSPRIALAVRVRDQQYLTPSRYVGALAKSVGDRGGKILEDTAITGIERRRGTLVLTSAGAELDADAVVVATGAWIGALATPHGIRVPVYGGRGYSFTLDAGEPFTGPLYFPAARVAVTPQQDRVRVAGIMEFGSPDAPARPGRIATMVRSVATLLDGVDWATRRDDWMGPRPLTTDGVPIVGESRTAGLFVAGGHGMWGVTLGPLTGSLLASEIATGVVPPELVPLDPRR